MPKPRSDEQFPLLLFLVGDQTDMRKENKRFGKRFEGITSGASAVITEWPNYISSCWVTMLICGITLFLLSLMMMSCLTIREYRKIPHCSQHQSDNTTIFLVQDSNLWSKRQFQLIDQILHSFPNYKIELIVMKTRYLFNKIPKKKQNLAIMNKSKVLSMFLGNNTPDYQCTIEEFTKRHTNIKLSYYTYDEIFYNSPLTIIWPLLNSPLRLLAVRALQLWQHGGLSFDITHSHKRISHICDNGTLRIENIRNMITNGSEKYENLQPAEVSIDEVGLHMATKMPCHAFFGEVLAKVAAAQEGCTLRNILKGPMFNFCTNHVIEQKYCVAI